jgi:hypothetical protein
MYSFEHRKPSYFIEQHIPVFKDLAVNDRYFLLAARAIAKTSLDQEPRRLRAQEGEPRYEIESMNNKTFLIKGLAQQDLLSLIGPGGLSRTRTRDDQPAQDNGEGIISLGLSVAKPESGIIIARVAGEQGAELLTEVMDRHFASGDAMRLLTKKALKDAAQQRKRQY